MQYPYIDKFLETINTNLNLYNLYVIPEYEIYKNLNNASESDKRWHEYELYIFELQAEMEKEGTTLETLSREKTVRDYYNNMINSYEEGVREGLKKLLDDFIPKLQEQGKTPEEIDKYLEDLTAFDCKNIVTRFKNAIQKRYEFYKKAHGIK